MTNILDNNYNYQKEANILCLLEDTEYCERKEVSGKTSKQGIITEIKEELGVDIVKENIKLFKTIKTEDDFVDIYYLKEDIDIKKIKIQKEEVEDVKWATIEEINELIKNEAFSESHTEFFELCLDYLKLK